MQLVGIVCLMYTLFEQATVIDDTRNAPVFTIRCDQAIYNIARSYNIA
jgi:hypothetical protein